MNNSMSEPDQTNCRKRKQDERDDAEDPAAKRARLLFSSNALLREPYNSASLVLIDADTGLARRLSADEEAERRLALIGDLSLLYVAEAIECEVLACSDQSKPFTDNAVARIAAAILKNNAQFDYSRGTWSITTRANAETAESQQRVESSGEYLCSLLRDNVSNVLREFARLHECRPAYLSAVYLAHNASACKRVVAQMERLMLWHVQRMEPPPDAPSAEEVQQIRELLAGRLVPAQSHCKEEQPALVRLLWTDYCARFPNKLDRCCGGRKRFIVVVSDVISAWSRKHSWCRMAHWAGYRWNAK
jgi:hypothetical protein